MESADDYDEKWSENYLQAARDCGSGFAIAFRFGTSQAAANMGANSGEDAKGDGQQAFRVLPGHGST